MMVLLQLSDQLTEYSKLRVCGSSDATLQLHLDRWGLTDKLVEAKTGPWGSFILRCGEQHLALDSELAGKLFVNQPSSIKGSKVPPQSD